MGAYVPGTLEAYQKYSLMATVSDFDQLRSLVSESISGRGTEVQLKVDTGMGRLGVLPRDALALVQEAYAADIEVAGIFSHLATADDPDPTFAKKQIQTFEDLLAELKKTGRCPRCATSSTRPAFCNLTRGRTTMARVGLGLYGLYPSDSSKGTPLRPAMSWKTRVATIKRVPVRDGCKLRADLSDGRKETTLVTIPVGLRRRLHPGTRVVSSRC